MTGKLLEIQLDAFFFFQGDSKSYFFIMSYPATEAPKLEIIFLLASLQAVAACLAAATKPLTKVILGRVSVLAGSHGRCHGEA